MAKKPQGGAAAKLAPDRNDFELDEQRAESFRAAMDDPGTGDGPSPIEAFWTRTAADLGFEVGSLVLIDTPETGPIKFSAVPTGVTEIPAETPAPPASPEDATVQDEREGLDPEGTQERSLGLMADAAATADIEAGTLRGDVTAALLEVVKRIQKPWDAHSQFEKRNLATALDEISAMMVTRAVEVAMADGQPTIRALVEKVDAGEKVKIVLKLGAMPEDEAAAAVSDLYHCIKKPVLILSADNSRFMSRRRDPIPPDQENLPFEAGRDDGIVDPPQITEEELYAKARDLVVRNRKASTSWLQRELRLGYNSAARLIEQMEAEGVVGPPDASGAREVLAPVPDDSDLAGDDAPGEEDQAESASDTEAEEQEEEGEE